MFENIRLALIGIWSHKMRSLLTMLGIIIGIASIISIVSTIKGSSEQLKKNLIGSGNNTVEVQLKESGYDYEIEYSGIPQGVPVLTQDIRDQILEIDDVEDAALYLKRQVSDGVYYNNTSISGAYVIGADQHYCNAYGYQLKKGRLFSEKDYKDFHKVVVIDTDAAQNLFQDKDPVGQTIEIKGEPFTVIGIIEEGNKYDLVINSIEEYYEYMQESGGTIIMPDVDWPIVYNYDEPQNVLAKAKDTESMSSVGKKVATLLNNNLTTKNTEIKYKADDALEQAKETQQLTESTKTQLIWIASISLLVGGIGVMNIMLVSVTERTSEIGLKKAIGAPNETILVQFLTEAAALTSIGGVVGVIAGIILSQIISKISETPVAISIPSIIISVIFSMFIGIVFGLLPSVKASKLNPIDALRHE